MDDSWSPLVLPILEAQCEASLHRHPERMYRYVFFFNLKKYIYFFATLFRNSMLILDEMSLQKASKFAIFFWNTKNL